MAFKKILCALCGGDGDVAALETAFAVAKPQDGHVAALFVRNDPREAVPMMGEGVSGTLVEQIVQIADRDSSERAGTARQRFEAVRARFGAAPAAAAPGPGGLSASWTEAVGHFEEVPVQAARLADLTVFPRVGVEQESYATMMLEAVLMGSGRPVLIAPAAAPASVGRKVAVCWNGTAEASRAVALAMGVLAIADEVHVLSADTGKTKSGTAAGLVEMLAWHGVRAVPRPVQVRGEAVGAALLRTAGEAGCDLLVMGGYGHSRLREMILGGVTRHVLNHATLPVLMAH